MSISRDDLVSRLIDKGSDSMGRWTYCKYAGKQGKSVTVVMLYQVCNRPTNEIGNTAFHQQVTQIATEQLEANIQVSSAPQPRLRFRNDLMKFLRQLRQKGESIVLMGDFNEDITAPESKLQVLFQDRQLQFIDMIARRHPQTRNLPTYIRGSTRLDFILVSPEIEASVQQCGYLHFHSHFRTDHRFAFLDLDTKTLFGSATSKLSSHAFREFTSKDPKQVEKYIMAKHKILVERNFFPRLEALNKLPLSSPDHMLAEQLDACWTSASLAAAKKCKARRREWWSIPLHQGALETKSLLQTHLTGLRTGKDLSGVIEARVAKLSLPPVPTPTTIDATNQALKAIQKKIKEIRADSKSSRDQSSND